MQYVASISYGKDSMAMLEVIMKHNMPLDRIVHVEIMATGSISADLPEVMEWKEYADDVIKHRYGIKVERISAEQSYEDLFYGVPNRSQKNQDKQGLIRGFPSLHSQWCSKSLKVNVIKKFFKKKTTVQYIGIAANETKRFGQLNESIRAPLVEHDISEGECYKICEKIGLLAPTYLQSKRSGCWFCHAQPIAQLRLLRRQHPELWGRLLEWDAESPIPFRHGKRHGTHTVADFENRFALEDAGILVPFDSRFKWAKMEEYNEQLSRRTKK